MLVAIPSAINQFIFIQNDTRLVVKLPNFVFFNYILLQINTFESKEFVGIIVGIVNFLLVSSPMLTDKQVKSFKPETTDKKKSDAQGLYLLVKKNGSKLWQMAYRFNGKQKVLSLGAYPLISLADARQGRDNAKREIADGIDPNVSKQQRKAQQAKQSTNTFENISREWWNTYKDGWTEKHSNDVISSLEKKIYPYLGSVVIKNITTPLIFEILKKIQDQGAIETAQRIRQRIEAVFNYAIAKGVFTESNPASCLKGALKKPIRKRKQPSLSNLEDLKAMMMVVDKQGSHPVTKLAYRFLSIVGTRPSEAREMRWNEIEGNVWTIPSYRLKMKKEQKLQKQRDHKVFLSSQAVEILEFVKRFSKNSPFVFPSTESHFHALSENAVGYMINRAGYQGIHCPHGFRASFSTIMNERYPQDRYVIDLMLAHTNKDKVEAAYNRSEHNEKRKQYYQIYADLLFDGLISLEELIAVPRRS